MMRARAPWIVVGITGIAALSLPAVAAPGQGSVARQPAATPMSHADRAEALLTRGRALMARKRYAEAVAVFDAALREIADEPRVLNELGVALRETGDLARAETVCREVAKRAEPELRAPALYNLGRVLERRGDTAAAIAAYNESLHTRHSRGVRERLIALDAKATTKTTQTHPLQGPVPSIEQWCSQHDGLCGPDTMVVFPDPDPSHDPDPAWQPGRHAPWEEVRVFVAESAADAPECVLGLRTARGWFVDRIPNCAGGHYRSRGVRAQLEDAIAGSEGNELQIRLSSYDPYRTWDEASQHTAYDEDNYMALLVCGLGRSRIPHCTPSIDLVAPHATSAQIDALVPSWKQGLLILEPTAFAAWYEVINDRPCRENCDQPRLPPTLREFAGRHRILFP